MTPASLHQSEQIHFDVQFKELLSADEKVFVQDCHVRTSQNFAHFYLTFLHIHQSDYAKLDQEIENIRNALQFAVDYNLDSTLINSSNAIYLYLESRGHYHEARHWLHFAEVRLSDERVELVTLLLYMGRLYERLTQHKLAQSTLWRGVAIARGLHATNLVCELLVVLAEYKSTQEQYRHAENLLHLALRLGKRLHESVLHCKIQSEIGRTSLLQGKFEQSEKAYTTALELARRLGDSEQVIELLTGLGVVASGRNQFALAVTYYQEALVVAEERGNIEQISLLLVNLGQRAGEMGEVEKAYRYLRRAIGYARRLQRKARIFVILLNLAQLANRQDEQIECDNYLEQCLLYAQQLESPTYLARLLCEWGAIDVQRGRLVEAERSFQACVDHTEGKSAQASWSAYALLGLAELYHTTGQNNEIPSLIEQCTMLAATVPEDDFLQSLVKDGIAWYLSINAEQITDKESYQWNS